MGSRGFVVLYVVDVANSANKCRLVTSRVALGILKALAFGVFLEIVDIVDISHLWFLGFLG